MSDSSLMNSEGAASDAACGQAMKLQIAGQAVQADQIYRAVLQAEPAHALANHCMGMLQVQLQRHEAALPYLAAALNAKPEAADYWLGYLEALLLAGRPEEAGEILALASDHGLAGAAVADFARRLAARLSPILPRSAPLPAPATGPASRRPRSADSRKTVRAAGKARGGARGRDTRPLHPREVKLQTLVQQDRRVEALKLARTLTQEFPGRGLGWKILGGLLWWQGLHEEALAPMQAAARLMPQDAEAHNNAGMALLRLLRYDEAVACFQRALGLDPKLAAAHYHLGMAHSMQEHYAEAEKSLCRAIALRPDYITAEAGPVHSDLLFILSHSTNYDGATLFAQHRRFGALLENQLPAWPAHTNAKDPGRRLKVGFVSGDLNNHAVANFIEPVLARLCLHPGVELHAYYNNVLEDGVTRRLRGYFKRWHQISMVTDADLAQQIMDDGMDILIDLSGHTALNRLRALARKPAPLQVSWIGYPGTTGLRAFDYYFADRHWLPPGQFAAQFVEKLVYLPATAPFEPLASAPAVNTLPALETGAVTFGSFNRLGKISAPTLRLWSQLLLALPTARLLLGGMPADGSLDDITQRFAAEGIAGDRLTLHRRASMDSYLALHHKVDICLDTFPYSGGTTTYHAMWMGVPTLTLDGSTPAGRQSAAILGQVGLDGFIAASPADFVRRGIDWAGRLDELAELRAEVRGRWQKLPNQRPDATGDAVELALRQMWQRWCAGLPPESFEPLPMDRLTQEAALLTLIGERRFSEALVQARAMADRFPEHGLSWKILGALLGSDGHMQEALAAMRKSAALLPNDAEAHSNLGTTLTKLNLYDEAEASHRRALQIDPAFATGHYRLGMTYEQQGRYAEAEDSLRTGIALRRNYAEGQDAQNYSNLLFVLSHNPQLDGDSLFAEHRRFAGFFEDPQAARRPRHLNSPDPDRRLQIGFVSGDLHNHAVATFIEPILSRLSLNPEFDLHAYYNNTVEDGITLRLRGYFKHWCAVSSLSDGDLATRISDDRIDILIDLSGHTALNRLPAFARKPAPLQLSWIGYPGTTGLGAMDYFIADPCWLPPGQFDRHFTEKLVFLPATAPFRPHPAAPAVNPLPALENGFPTFGSFNRAAKINSATVQLWADLMLAMPQSKLLLGGMPVPGPHQKLTGQFAAAGIPPERLTFHPRSDMDTYLALHHQTDICLDTYPYSGGTTTYHALWMGVPTLTVAGSTPAGRQGAAILAQIGLDDFIAADGSDFVRRGVHWGTHPALLAQIRAGLRTRFADSPNQRPEVIVDAFERALKRMWRRWCDGLAPESFEINDAHCNGPNTP